MMMMTFEEQDFLCCGSAELNPDEWTLLTGASSAGQWNESSFSGLVQCLAARTGRQAEMYDGMTLEQRETWIPLVEEEV